jgi:hypothetical protein
MLMYRSMKMDIDMDTVTHMDMKKDMEINIR